MPATLTIVAAVLLLLDRRLSFAPNGKQDNLLVVLDSLFIGLKPHVSEHNLKHIHFLEKPHGHSISH